MRIVRRSQVYQKHRVLIRPEAVNVFNNLHGLVTNVVSVVLGNFFGISLNHVVQLVAHFFFNFYEELIVAHGSCLPRKLYEFSANHVAELLVSFVQRVYYCLETFLSCFHHLFHDVGRSTGMSSIVEEQD